MEKDNTIIIIIIAIVAIVLFKGGLLFAALPSGHSFTYKGFPAKVDSSTGLVGLGSSCSSWGGTAELDGNDPTSNPLSSINGSVKISAYSSFAACSGDSAGAGFTFSIPNPKSYKTIFLTFSGFARTGYGGTSNCPSAGIGGSMSQSGSGSTQLFSKSAGCPDIGSATAPVGVLINIADGFAIIPSTSTAFELKNDNDLVFGFSVSANANANQRAGNAELTITLDRLEKIVQSPTPVVQCNTIADCASPCSGITTSCVSNECQYSGNCTSTVIYQNNTVYVGGENICPAVCKPLYILSNNCALDSCGSGCGANNINTFAFKAECEAKQPIEVSQPSTAGNIGKIVGILAIVLIGLRLFNLI